MIVPVMAISNLVLTQQIYSEETNGAHAHYREPVPLSVNFSTFSKYLPHSPLEKTTPQKQSQLVSRLRD